MDRTFIRLQSFLLLVAYFFLTDVPVGAQSANYSTVEQKEAVAPEVRWLHEEAKWGIGNHYLAGGVLNQAYFQIHDYEQWNHYITRFDVEAYADLVKEIGVGYVIFTITQNRGYLATPSDVYDRHSPAVPAIASGYRRQPGTDRVDYTPERDLVGELAEALNSRGIRFIAYVPSHVGYLWTGRNQDPPVYPDWYTGEFITELAQRWGDSVSGWWFDGLYTIRKSEQQNGFPVTGRIWDSVRRGNSKAILTHNAGIAAGSFTTHEPFSQFVPGEQVDLLPLPNSRSVSGWNGKPVQWVGWTFLAKPAPGFFGWGQITYNLRFKDHQVADLSLAIHNRGGVPCWDIPINIDGSWPLSHLKQLQTIGLKMKKAQNSKYASLELINDDSNRVRYDENGLWQGLGQRGTGAYNQDVHATQANGSSASLTFDGPSVVFATSKAPDQGDVEVFLDGDSKGLFSTSDPYRRQVQSIIFERHDLDPGEHTIRIVKRSGRFMLVDLFGVVGR